MTRTNIVRLLSFILYFVLPIVAAQFPLFPEQGQPLIGLSLLMLSVLSVPFLFNILCGMIWNVDAYAVSTMIAVCPCAAGTVFCSAYFGHWWLIAGSAFFVAQLIFILEKDVISRLKAC